MKNKTKNIPNQHLLKNRKVIEEINRHLWIESERAGYDIGFDQAAEDWLIRFSKAWMRYHLPKKKVSKKKKPPTFKRAIKKRSSSRRRTAKC